ncbi:hypothetical protein RDI58_011475 [Solanum bulbocastanum]|uniref:Uncharacterized protein n=1 Tax=Solanum bulbocastanum TaxID=147425 RepID=A0AAN8TSU9_SOLBU
MSGVGETLRIVSVRCRMNF